MLDGPPSNKYSTNSMADHALGAFSDGSNPRPGPLFVSGRQHCGNTVMSVLIGRMPGIYAQTDESTVFEVHALLDRMRDPVKRACQLDQFIALESTEHQAWLSEELRRRITESPGTPTLTVYLETMDALADRMNCHRWVQKATSYIFYAQEILDRIPQATMIYLLRNPWDLVASRRRREPSAEAVLSTMMGWSRGLNIARTISRDCPGRFRIVRYEDMTGEQSTATIKSVCEWMGEPFSEDLLNVPHVNPAESKFKMESERRGLNRSKQFQYIHSLTDAEIAATDQLVAKYGLQGEIEAYFPELPHKIGSQSDAAIRAGRRSLRWAPLRYAWGYLTRIRRSPRHLIARTIRRMKAGR